MPCAVPSATAGQQAVPLSCAQPVSTRRARESQGATSTSHSAQHTLPSSSRHAPHDRVYPLLPLLQHQPVAIRLVLDLARKAGAEVGCGDGHGGGESSRQWAHATTVTSTA